MVIKAKIGVESSTPSLAPRSSSTTALFLIAQPDDGDARNNGRTAADAGVGSDEITGCADVEGRPMQDACGGSERCTDARTRNQKAVAFVME